MHGGEGSDTFRYNSAFNNTTIFIGGNGDDYARFFSFGADSRHVLKLGNGNDVIDIGDGGNAGEGEYFLTLGNGMDRVNINDLATGFRQFNSVTIFDFHAGEAGDILNLNFAGDTPDFDGAQDPFVQGIARLAAVLDGTEVQFDTGGGQWKVVATLKGVDAYQLTAFNFLGYDPTDSIFASGLGTSKNDIIDGTSNDDNIVGLEGNDTINGLGGDDTIDGGAGNDRLTGGAGADTLLGGLGNDLVFADADDLANGRIDGGDGFDRVYFSGSTEGVTANASVLNLEWIAGSNQADVLSAGSVSRGIQLLALGGDDSITGGAFNDFVRAGLGADTVDGGAGNDFLSGEDGNDTLDGGMGNDRLFGGADNDTLLGGAGRDLLNGGAGDDTLEGHDDADTLLGLAGNDLIFGDGGNDRLNGGSGADTLFGGLGRDLLSGGTGNDILYGDEDADTLVGQEGADELLGGAGNDRLNGGADNDLLEGGEGNDMLQGGTGGDRLLGGSGNDLVVGGDGDDTLDGGTGSDRVNGGAGDDVLFLSSGSDSLTGGAGSDLFAFSGTADSATDTILDFEDGTDRIDLSRTDAASIDDVSILQSGSFVLITVDGESALVRGSNVSGWSAADFVFAGSAQVTVASVNIGPEFADVSGEVQAEAAPIPPAALDLPADALAAFMESDSEWGDLGDFALLA